MEKISTERHLTPTKSRANKRQQAESNSHSSETWLVPKSVKFDRKKLAKAVRQKKIKKLAEMCRQQLDILIAE